MNPAVIFDLDQTLVDTRHIASLRKDRNWSSVYREIKGLKTYHEIDYIFEKLQANKIDIIIITMSPSSYCSIIIEKFNWKITGSICYHDVRPNIKPHPEPFLKAIRDYDLDKNKIISAGDSAIDIIASNRANIPSIACSWDTNDLNDLLSSNPTFHAPTPNDLLNEIMHFHNLN